MNRKRTILSCILLVALVAAAIPLGKQIVDAYAVRSKNLKEFRYVDSLNDKILLWRGINNMTTEIEELECKETVLDRDIDKISKEIRQYENEIDNLNSKIRQYEDEPVVPDNDVDLLITQTPTLLQTDDGALPKAEEGSGILLSDLDSLDAGKLPEQTE